MEEICEIYAQGTVMKEVLRYVGLSYAQWHKWRKDNYCFAGERFEFAHVCHLEAMADKTLRVFEQLEAERKACMAAFSERHDAGEEKMNARQGDERAPVEPIYWGPSEWELEHFPSASEGFPTAVA